MPAAIASLAKQLLHVRGQGRPRRRRGVVRQVRRDAAGSDPALESTRDIPVDITPEFELAQRGAPMKFILAHLRSLSLLALPGALLLAPADACAAPPRRCAPASRHHCRSGIGLLPQHSRWRFATAGASPPARGSSTTTPSTWELPTTLRRRFRSRKPASITSLCAASARPPAPSMSRSTASKTPAPSARASWRGSAAATTR